MYYMKYYEIKGLGLSFSVACARPEMKNEEQGTKRMYAYRSLKP